ncbi:MAG: polysaccharide deacetylase family protein [Micavibrio aeruginosavorus]|uniref:Polysaccharide deacetylase family protein n=1 Tax=Micavibrio aeruginosavorus TaxID=349221 RepID=A0A7T5R1D9_9BACT|nr:MAG: polysaccharide deacetylase family protein [Micavibrio aeruginosavorus]
MLTVNRFFYMLVMFPAYALMALGLLANPAHAQKLQPIDTLSAVIFTYHHIGDDLMPSANLLQEQFEAHINELTSGAYHVLPLTEIVEKLKAQTPLPDPTIGISFDGAHRNTLNYAAPLLLKAGIPFTVFISTDAVDAQSDDTLHWDDLRKLAKQNLVTIALHPASYKKLHDKDEAEIARQINNAVARYRAQLGHEPELFAYPYGELSLIYKRVVERAGFKAAFGQQSGVAYSGADMFMLPRFSMTEPYGSIERFRMTAMALPLPVSDMSPQDPYVTDQSTLDIGFTVDEPFIGNIKSLSCFASTAEKADLQIIGKNRVEIRLKTMFEDERGRINCTMPGPIDEVSEQTRWRWFGMMLTVAVPYADYEPAGHEDSDDSINLVNQLQPSVE